jgi:hypothetical protein
MKVEVINYTRGTVEAIETGDKTQPFVYKDRYLASLSHSKSIYEWDGTKKSSKKEKTLYFSTSGFRRR